MLFPALSSVRTVRLTIIVAVSLTALLLAVGPAGAEDTGPPVIDITSGGGYASGFYILRATVSGDMASGSAYYGIDTDDDGAMEEMDDAGAFFEKRIELEGMEDGSHTFYVKAFNSTGVSAVASVVMDIDNNSPTVELITNHSTIYGNFVFQGKAEDPYLNESAVYCMLDDDEVEAKTRPMTRVGDHFEVTIDTTQLTDGEHLARIWAHDLWGNSNKSTAIVLFVSSKANLVITAVDWQKSKVEVDQDVVVVVTVLNEGGTAASGFKVGITVGDKVVATTKVEETVASGDSLDVTVKWSMGEEGSREASLKVDTGDDIEESKENDNDWSDQDKVTFEGGSPGFGALLAVLAVAISSIFVSNRGRH